MSAARINNGAMPAPAKYCSMISEVARRHQKSGQLRTGTGKVIIKTDGQIRPRQQSGLLSRRRLFSDARQLYGF
jgi:hypothetical protein